MREDHRFAAEIAIACEIGEPLSIFLGRLWPDPRSPLVPKWLDSDQDYAVSYRAWRAQVCPQCGLHPLDWPNERDETWKGHTHYCWGCVEVDDTRKAVGERLSDERKSQLRVTLVPRTEGERLLLEAYERDEIELDELERLTGR